MFETQPERASIEEIRAFDRWAVKIGLSPLVLMENAGREVARAARSFLVNSRKKRVAVFSGPGNNGGDGFVAARYLYNWEMKPEVFLITKREELKKEARVNFEILMNLKIDYYELDDEAVYRQIPERISSCGLVIDAILGTGLKKQVEGNLAAVIEAINEAGSPVIAVDIPSGMDGDTGKILGCAVKARKTVTMAALKEGFLNPQAQIYLGEVKVADLGVVFRKVKD